MVKLPNDLTTKGSQIRYNVWLKIMFVDNDGTFIGKVDKIDSNFTLYNKGEHIKLDTDMIKLVFKEGQQFCYGDNVTICGCKGLCKDK